MYVGRIVTIGKSDGKPFAGYRVSSRSFPNRITKVVEEGIAVWPIDPEDMKRNPYIAYNCFRQSKNGIVISNGTQTDPIFEELEKGTAPEEALRKVLIEMGYERDSLNTPRIAGIIVGDTGYLGIVRDNGCETSSFPLTDGKCRIITTYEMNHLEDADYDVTAKTADEAAEYVISGGVFATLELPVCSCAYFGGEVAVKNPK